MIDLFPFEIHITVDMSDDIFNIDTFKKMCDEIEVKPIVIELEINKDSCMKDIMTSSKHYGTMKSSKIESERISNYLSDNGFKVLRKKIETVPSHYLAPKDEVENIPHNLYFESHIGVPILPTEKDELNKVVDKINSNQFNGISKLSRNFLKKSKDGKLINMITYRSYKGGSDTFQKEVELIKSILISYGFQFEKVEVEFCIFDTNIEHDKDWIGESTN